MKNAFLHVEDLHVAIGAQEILRGVDLEIDRGQTLVVIGRSGGGKSVLLKNIIGLMKPDRGRIWFDGTDIVEIPERHLGPVRKRIGILFQSGALFDSMSVEENVAFPLVEAGVRDRDRIREEVQRVLKVVELDGHQHKMPVELSGGMKKRVGLARTIVNHPDCILYDEPTAGLDPVVSDSINHLIRRLQTEFQVTSIVVTHDMKSAYHVADRIAFLREGRIYFNGTARELEHCPDESVQDFIHGRSREIDDL